MKTLWACCLTLLSLPVLGQSVTITFDNANKLYEQGKFSEAAASYEKLLQSGLVADAVYFNLGNAFFKGGHIGRAIVAYVQAQRIVPRDPDVRANLQFARNQVQGPTFLPERLSRWLGKLTLNEWTWLAAAAVWLCLLLLSLMQLRPVLKPVLKAYTLWCGLLALFLFACFSAAFYFDRLSHRAIVVAQEAVARQAPLDESQSAFTLHDGAELQVLDQKDQWLQVRADARRVGWIHRDSVLIQPSI